mmetsp:Transcript_29417/g.40430  ORF Transcript_29417/g.40430 Transcript_29417/m.40430 type:complete len:163 (+) Transcript_29417:18-506(+)
MMATYFCCKCMATASLGVDPSKACEQPPHHFVPTITQPGAGEAKMDLYMSAVDYKQNGVRLTRSMKSVLDMIKSCDFEKLPENLLSDYKRATNEKLSTPFLHESHLSMSSQVVRGYIELSNLNFGCLATGNNTYEWKIQDQLIELEERLCLHIFRGDRVMFN